MILKDKVMGREVESTFESLALSEADDITYLRGLEKLHRFKSWCVIYFGDAQPVHVDGCLVGVQRSLIRIAHAGIVTITDDT